MTPAAIPPSRAWMGDGGFSVSIGEALIILSPSRASSVRLLGFFTPLDRTLCGNESTTPRNASASVGERVRRDREGGGNRWRHYQLLGAAGAAAEGAEEEDGDGAGEEEACGGLERGGIVVGGEERRGAELHGALAFGVDGAGVGGLWLRCGGRRRRRRIRLGVDSGGAAEAAAGKRERRGEGEAASW